MNSYSLTYSRFDSCGNTEVSAKYVVDNLVMCENRVNTHSHRTYFTKYFLNIKELAIPFSRVLLTFPSDFYLRNGAPPLRVVAVTALHHAVTVLSVGTHRALSVMPYFLMKNHWHRK